MLESGVGVGGVGGGGRDLVPSMRIPSGGGGHRSQARGESERRQLVGILGLR